MGFALALILGASTGMAFSGLEEPARYRAILGFGMIFPILVIVTSIGVLLESPRFLLMVNRRREARLVLSKIYPKGYNVGAVLEDMEEALQRSKIAEGGTGWSVIFHPTSAFRRSLLLGWGISFTSQAVGIDAITYYMLDVMGDAGVEVGIMQTASFIGLTIINFQCIAISARLLDRVGRRTMLFVSLTGKPC
jgi:MFS family permease